METRRDLPHSIMFRVRVSDQQVERVAGHDDFSPRRFASALRESTSKLAEQFGLTSTAAQTLRSKTDLQTSVELETAAIPASIAIRLNIGTRDSANFRKQTGCRLDSDARPF